VKFVQKVHTTPATIQLKKELLLHGAARQDAMMLDQVVLAQRATVPHVHQDVTTLVHHDVMTQVVAVLVPPDPKVGAQKVTDQHAHQDATIDQADHVQVVHAPKVTDQVVSGRAGPVRQMIAQHAEDQRVHVVIPTSLRVPKQQKNVNR